MNIKSLSIVATAGLMAAMATPAFAVAASSPLNVASLSVKANVVPDCSISSKSGNFDFGKFDVQAGFTPKNTAPTYSVSFSCNNGTKWAIFAGSQDLSAGAYTGTMSDGSGDSAGYTITGDSNAGGTAAHSADVTTSVLTAAMTTSDPHVGTYSDTVAITLSYQ